MNHLAFSFRSSPRTSALAMGERETALGYPPCGHRAHTYTHIPLSRAQESPGRSLSLPRFFPLATRTPSTRRRITRAARVRKPSAENRSHIQNLSVFPLSTCVVYPQHTTHIRAFAFPSCYHDCPVTHLHWFAFASFRSPFSDFMVHRTLEPCA